MKLKVGGAFVGFVTVLDGGAGAGSSQSGCGVGPCCAKDGGAIVERTSEYFGARFEDDELLSSDECEYSIGGGLSVFDEIGVYAETAAVQAREFDHGAYLSRTHRQWAGSQ
jgi:hypothetical protein